MFVIVDAVPTEGKWLVREGDTDEGKVLACCHTVEAAEFVANCVNIVGHMLDAAASAKLLHLMKKRPG